MLLRAAAMLYQSCRGRGSSESWRAVVVLDEAGRFYEAPLAAAENQQLRPASEKVSFTPGGFSTGDQDQYDLHWRLKPELHLNHRPERV